MNPLNVNKILLLSCVQAFLSTGNSYSSESHMTPLEQRVNIQAKKLFERSKLKRILDEFYEDRSISEERPTKKSRKDVQKEQEFQHPINSVTKWNHAETYHDRGGTNPSNLNKNEVTEAVEILMLMDTYTSNPKNLAEEYSCEIIEEGTIEIKDNALVQNNSAYPRTNPIDFNDLIDHMDWEEYGNNSEQSLRETLYNSEKEQSSNQKHSSNTMNIEKPITHLDRIGNMVLHQYLAKPHIKDLEINEYLEKKGVKLNSVTKLDFIKVYLACCGYNIPFDNKNDRGRPNKNFNIKDEIKAFFIFKNNPNMSFEDITKSEHYNEAQKRTLRFTKAIYETIVSPHKMGIVNIPKFYPDIASYRYKPEGETFIRRKEGTIHPVYANLIKIMLFASEMVTQEQLYKFTSDNSVFNLCSEKGLDLLTVEDFNSKFEKKSQHKESTQDRAEDNMEVYSDDTEDTAVNLLRLISSKNTAIEKK